MFKIVTIIYVKDLSLIMKFKKSFKTGFSFGIASGVVTTLGLMTGLYSSTQSQKVVLAGVLVIALADSLSDAFGIHFSEECKVNRSKRYVWEATFSTFLSKFFFTSTFIIPFLFLTLETAIYASFLWGTILLTSFSVYLAKQQKEEAWKQITKNLSLAVSVIFLTYWLGQLINYFA